MKKEYHLSITRRDRIYLSIMVAVLLGWELIKPLMTYPKGEYQELDLRLPPDSTHSYASKSYSKKYARPYKKRFYPKPGYREEREEEWVMPLPEPEAFDMMTATLDQLMAAGFQRKTANNILKYISAGGTIRNEIDLMRIYGMDSVQLHAALPFIQFPPIEENTITQKNFSKSYPEKIITLVDLNSATLAELDSLPGVGPVLGERIIKFRNSLGGFYAVDQLQECYGMPPETYERIKSQLIIIQPHQLIQLDTIKASTFSHPYFPKKILKIHQAYTRHHGSIRHAEELRKIYPPDTLWYAKLLPYLSFPGQ